MATTPVFIEKAPTTATITWNASYIDDSLLEHYAHDIIYKLYNSDDYWTVSQKAAIERPSFTLSNLEHNNHYIVEVRPYRIFRDITELGLSRKEITFKTDCIGQHKCNMLFIKRVVLIIIVQYYLEIFINYSPK